MSSPAADSPYRSLEHAALPAPLLPREIREALFRPHRAADLILADYGRIRGALADPACVGRLIALLVLASGLFALPYGLVLEPSRALHVAALYLGAVALCFPSLHVFTAYLGCRMRVSQNLVMALLISAVAALFTLGFAPILWFLRLTTESPGLVQTASFLLLAVSLLAGLGQLGRALWDERAATSGDRYRATVLAWQGLLVFVTFRLASCLGLT